MMKMWVLLFMLLLTYAYDADPIWCIIVDGNYHGHIEVFSLGYKCNICHFM